MTCRRQRAERWTETSAPAHAGSLTDAFLTKINGVRSTKGLAPMQLSPALSSFAQDWSDRLAAAGTLSHNPDLASSPGQWTRAGENVGVGADVETLFNVFVASPHHYANLIDPDFNLIGIGITVSADGNMWTTEDFEAHPDAVTRPPAPAAPEAAPRTSSPPPAAVEPQPPSDSHGRSATAPTTQAPAPDPTIPAKQMEPAPNAAASPTSAVGEATAPTTAPLSVDPTVPAPAAVAAAPSDTSGPSSDAELIDVQSVVSSRRRAPPSRRGATACRACPSGRVRPRLSSGRRLVVSTAAAGLLAVIVVAFAAGTHGVGGLRVARVRGTSMNPTFQAGDLVLVRRRRRYDVGEIVAYRRSGGELVIHRVAAKAGDELRLKGDNNPAADPDWVAVKDIIGHEVLHAPHGLPWLSVAVLAVAATALATAWSPRLRQRP